MDFLEQKWNALDDFGGKFPEFHRNKRYIRPMANLNALRHTIVYSDTAWEKYTTLVDGFILLGTIQRGSNHVGAFAVKDGKHYCITNGLCEPLNERRVSGAIPYATHE